MSGLASLYVGDHVEGRQVARCRDLATRGGGGALHRHSLSTCHPNGAQNERKRMFIINILSHTFYMQVRSLNEERTSQEGLVIL